jgi:hypothetical protein
MISLIRLEAEGSTLPEVVADIDAKTKALKLPKDMYVHDEHYERVAATGLYKGRRVFKHGAPLLEVKPKPYVWGQVGTAATAASWTPSITPLNT